MKKYLIFLLLLKLSFNSFGQGIPRFNPDTIISVIIDSVVVIKNAKAGLSVDDFIYQIENDTSFYEAFRNIKKYDFIAKNDVYTYDKGNKVEGNLFRKIKHHKLLSGKNKVEVLDERLKGNILKKNGKYDLYTVEMFNYIFMNAYASDYSSSSSSTLSSKGNNNQSYKDKLKTLIFNPGKPIKGIPIIANKTEIFSDRMKDFYNYSYHSGTYLDSIPVYRFKVTVKDDLSLSTKNGLMIKELTTIFDKRNFQILGRYIDMKLNNLAFDFDVQMNIELSYFKDDLLPVKISYQGNWDIPFKKVERASFLVLHENYR